MQQIWHYLKQFHKFPLPEMTVFNIYTIRLHCSHTPSQHLYTHHPDNPLDRLPEPGRRSNGLRKMPECLAEENSPAGRKLYATDFLTDFQLSRWHAILIVEALCKVTGRRKTYLVGYLRNILIG